VYLRELDVDGLKLLREFTLDFTEVIYDPCPSRSPFPPRSIRGLILPS
jgi:hypothetical protein